MAVLIGVAPTYAGNDAARAKCLEASNDLDQKILNCTLVIDDPTEATTDKFSLFLGRARAHFEKQEWGDSIIDYDMAISIHQDNAEAYGERRTIGKETVIWLLPITLLQSDCLQPLRLLTAIAG